MAEKAAPNRSLGLTAYWTAGVRARESVREDHLFNDPWAAALAGTEGLAWVEQRSSDSVIPIVLRTRFFDDFLQRIATDSGIRQIVLMAAGLDTRAFRLSWPQQVRFFELDQAPVLEYKEKILRSAGAKPNCRQQTITVDLTGPWETALSKAGFDPERPSGWLLEGFLYYLPIQNLTQLLDRTMNLAAPGSWIGFDIINSITLTSPLTQRWVEMQANSGAPWIGTMDDPKGFLAIHDFKTTVVPLGAREANYDRWPYPVIPATMPGMPHLWFVIGEKERPVPL